MLDGRARADGKPRVREGLRPLGSMRFDQRNLRTFADADRVLERIQSGLVVRRYEDQMDRFFEPRFRPDGEDRSIGCEGGAERRDDVAMPEAELPDRLSGSAIILQNLTQRLERNAMRILDGGQISPESSAHEHGAIGIQVSERFTDCSFDADIRRCLGVKAAKRMDLRH